MVRLSLGLGLLIAEIGLCSWLLDGDSLSVAVTEVRAASFIEVIFGLALVMSVGGLLLGGPALRNDLAQPLETLYRHRHGLPLLAVHLGLFATFVWFSSQLPFDIPTVPELIIDNQRWLPTGWVLLGLAVISYWVLFFLPAGVWSALVNHGLQMFLPSCLLAIGCVAAARFTWPLWTPLASVTMRCVFAVLTFFYSDAVFDPAKESVGTSHFEVTIGPLCSGFEGIGLGCFFLLNYFALFRSDLRFPAVLVLLPIAAVLMWLTNIARIAGLIAIGDAGRPDIALGGFHSQAGWLLFLIVSFGLVGVTRHCSCFMATPPADAAEPASTDDDSPLAYLVPLIVLLGAILSTRMFSTEFDGLYPVRVLIVTATLWFFRRSYARWEWRWSWPAVGLGIVVFVLWMALASADLRRDGDGLQTALDTIPFGWRVTWLTFRVLGSVLMVPLVEELAFRGFLIRRLISADVSSVTPGQFTWFSFLLSSVLFGLLHQRWFAGTLAGMFYALALYRRGNLVEAIIAHAVTNGLIAATVLLWGQWWLW